MTHGHLVVKVGEVTIDPVGSARPSPPQDGLSDSFGVISLPDYGLILRDPHGASEDRHMEVRLNKAPKRGSVFVVDGVGKARSRGALRIGGDLVIIADIEPSTDKAD